VLHIGTIKTHSTKQTHASKEIAEPNQERLSPRVARVWPDMPDTAASAQAAERLEAEEQLDELEQQIQAITTKNQLLLRAEQLERSSYNLSTKASSGSSRPP